MSQAVRTDPEGEITPLLRQNQAGDVDPSTLKPIAPLLMAHEVKSLFIATIPISASFLLQNTVQALSIIICGSVDPQNLAIASYGYMFASCTGGMVSIGGATALDTLCAQAITSSRAQIDPTILGRHLQQTLVLLTTLYLLAIMPIWLFCGRIFVALGQPVDFALGTGRFMLYLLPAGFAQMVAECLKKYAQVQGSSNTVGVAVAIAAAIGIAANIFFVRVLELGANGAALAHFVYQLVSLVLLIALVARKECEKKTMRFRAGWRDMLDGIGTNAFFCATGIMTIATEWWSFEILAMMAANLHPVYVSAQSILMSTDLVFTTLSLGIGVASSHRIGQLLGANKVLYIRRAAIAPYLLSVYIGVIEFFFIMVLKSQFGYLFTTDHDVIVATAKVLPALAVFQILDLSNGGAGGILRGAGKNHLSGVSNALAYYGVGLSLAWFFCFRLGWGLLGLWLGIISGSGALIVLQTAFILTLKWERLASEASGEDEARDC